MERVRWRVWDNVRFRRAAARAVARSSEEGASPKMKNFTKAKRIKARVNWPTRKPQAKDPEEGGWPWASRRRGLGEWFGLDRGVWGVRTLVCLLFGLGHLHRCWMEANGYEVLFSLEMEGM